jgi:phosphate acetyltransferase/phosphate butyryltransferase
MSDIENRTYDEINIGDSAMLVHQLTLRDIDIFAAMSGDVNPAHVDEDFARTDRFHKVIAHGMWGGSLISAVLGTKLPGPGTIYLEQSLTFHAPVGVGDIIEASVKVIGKSDKARVRLECQCINQNKQVVISGIADVVAPREKIRRPRVIMPEVELHSRQSRFDALRVQARDMAPLRTLVVHPVDDASLMGAVEGQKAGYIAPILIGPQARIKAAAQTHNIDINGLELIDVPHSHAAAAEAVRRVREGQAEALMKGALHTDELMGAVVAPDGLRTNRRISHVFVLDAPHYHKLLFITDAAVNIEPDLDVKADIVRNAIDFAHTLGIAVPKVALLAAVETVYPRMRSTLDAAALCKMLDRDQITGALMDGPLAFDNAISMQAAHIKHIRSDVAGDADILVAPEIESANMMAKQLIYLAGADAAGLVLGARVPIILTSRSDSARTREISALLALVQARVRGV